MSSSYLSTSKYNCLFLLFLVTEGCGTTSQDIENDISRGTISYPFIRTNPLGLNGPREKLIIKSIKGDTQYVIELPNQGQDYDIEIPIAQLDGDQIGKAQKEVGSPTVTDQELLQNLPKIEALDPKKGKLLDKAFGVGDRNSNVQSPSYSLGLAKINELYRQKKYEFALIEINNLLSFYPNSVKLLKMKGTVYSRLNDLELAEQSWLKALELEPNNQILQERLVFLRENRELQKKTQPKALPLP